MRAGGEEWLENHIEARGNPAGKRIKQAAQRCSLVGGDEFVENQQATSRFQDSGGFCQAGRRIRNDGQDEVQYDSVKAGIGVRQSLCVSLSCREIQSCGRREGPVQHGGREVEADIAVMCGQPGKIESSADAA